MVAKQDTPGSHNRKVASVQ